MDVNGPFVLQRDVLLVPCAELSEDARGRISFDEGDYTLSSRRSRVPVRVIDGETAALLAVFREPRTIVDAVVEQGRALGKSPRVWFDELLPHLEKLVENRFLVPADADDRDELQPRYGAGATIGYWEVVRCVSLVEDTEIYQVRKGADLAALKIARSRTKRMRSLIENEISILRDQLHGSNVAPRLLESGRHEDHSYAIIEWIAGVDAGVAAAQRRHDRVALIELCASIASAYAELHARGVLHGDVHMRNVIAGKQVTLIDFGYAHADGRRAGRAGMMYFYEPEYVAARRQGRSLPPSQAGEQYSVAALLYFLISGHHYAEFRYDRDEMIRQIEQDGPLSFAQRGIAPWPDVERILARALEKSPPQRYASVAELAERLDEVRQTSVRESLATPLTTDADALLETTLRGFERGGMVFATGFPPPTASVNLGAAGAAVGLLQIAKQSGDPSLLALASVWGSRAVARIGTDDAFENVDEGPSKQTVGEVTPYHTESGVHAAAAMIAAAMADGRSQQRATRAFIAASERPCPRLDVTLGRSGALLAASLLLPVSEEVPHTAKVLRAFGAKTMRAIWTELDEVPSIGASEQHKSLGMAHGWAGYLYAALRWCAASGDALPPRLRERLDDFASFQRAHRRGAYWPVAADARGDAMKSTWCNGSAGLVFLFTHAYRTFGDERWLELAELCAWTTWDEPRGPAHLCCGTAGRGYALLNFYKHTGARSWLSRARQMANHAAGCAASGGQESSLWRGSLGIAVLIADLSSPENARMPFFE